MGVTPVELFAIQNESEADDYLKDLLARPEYRSIDEVNLRAQKYIRDAHVKKYFVNKAKEMLNIAAPKIAALKAEDGAEFFGDIQQLEGGQVRASCYAQQDHKHSVDTETPEYMMCGSVAAAEEWIEQQAGQRGFKKYKLRRS